MLFSKQTQLKHALLQAVKNNNIITVEEIIHQNADLSATDTNNNTALHLASLYNHASIAKALIAANSTLVNRKNSNYHTPLQLAVINNNLNIATDLLQHHASANSTTFYFAPLNQEKLGFIVDIAWFLNFVWLNFSSHQVPYNMLPIVLMLFIQCINWALKEKEICTAHNTPPLIIATQNGQLDMVKLLLTYNAKLDAMDSEYSRTALHWAIQNMHINIVEYLLDKGADLNARDAQNQTPLEIALKMTGAKANYVVELLEQNRQNEKEALDNQNLSFSYYNMPV